MRLLGEVQVDRNDADYAQWGIKIMVSFREGDDMQRLTAKHQSGGVRHARSGSADRSGTRSLDRRLLHVPHAPGQDALHRRR